MKRAILFFWMGALLLSVAASAQQVALSTPTEGLNKKELAQRLSQDETFREYTIANWNYLKVVDEWKASLTLEQQKAREEGELMMPEFYTEEERKQFYAQQIKRLNKIKEHFPELWQLTEQESSWTRRRATDIVLEE